MRLTPVLGRESTLRQAAFDEPFTRFEQALSRVATTEPNLPMAATLATAAPTGRPSARLVLIRGVSPQGIIFYTNYQSRKGRELAANPYAALCVHWKSVAEQVRIEGRVERTTAAVSDAYFQARARGSQEAAVASDQSAKLASRDTLKEAFERVRLAHEGVDVPRPAHWGGFCVVPDRFEFWTERPHRLHEREVYEPCGEGWQVQLLNP